MQDFKIVVIKLLLITFKSERSNEISFKNNATDKEICDTQNNVDWKWKWEEILNVYITYDWILAQKWENFFF